eukprot:Opistho-2@32832
MARPSLSLREIAGMFAECFEVAIHTILYVRGVYPKEIFEPRKKFGVLVWRSRHPGLNEYISDAVADVRSLAEHGLVRKACVVIVSPSQRRTVERFVFDIAYLPVDACGGEVGGGERLDAHVSGACSPEDAEAAFRGILARVAGCTRPVTASAQTPDDAEFRIVVHADPAHGSGSTINGASVATPPQGAFRVFAGSARPVERALRFSWADLPSAPVEPSGGAEGTAMPPTATVVQPLRTVHAGPMRVSLVVECRD